MMNYSMMREMNYSNNFVFNNTIFGSHSVVPFIVLTSYYNTKHTVVFHYIMSLSQYNF